MPSKTNLESSEPASYPGHETRPALGFDGLRSLFIDAGMGMAQVLSPEANTTKKTALAAEWVARLVPVWRELLGQPQTQSSRHEMSPPQVGADALFKLIDGFLAVLVSRAPHVLEEHQRHAAIAKAKHEWECTADALTSLVCLLNSDGRVLRANRVLEHWGLGSVSGVLGKKVHAVLHPICADPCCEIACGLDRAWPRLRMGEPQELEFYTVATDQTLQLTLRPMLVGDEVNAAPRESFMVLVVTDISVLRRAQRALENSNMGLESRVRLRTRELDESNRDLRKEVLRRKHAEHELRASRNNLALLSEQLIQAQEGERRRIAIELHDSVGQSLSAIKYTVERAIIMLQKPDLGDPEDVLTLAVQRIHETADGIRSISMNLRPQMLDNLGAASATSWFCRGFAEIYPALTVHTEITAENSEIPQRISTHLFRCVQELLNNVAKHARAKTVWIILRREGGRLSLEVRDDGVGMADQGQDPSRLQGSGIRNLRERAEITGGTFTISPAPGNGTSARIAWNLDLMEESFKV